LESIFIACDGGFVEAFGWSDGEAWLLGVDEEEGLEAEGKVLELLGLSVLESGKAGEIGEISCLSPSAFLQEEFENGRRHCNESL
jgi:hypothetical protein